MRDEDNRGDKAAQMYRDWHNRYSKPKPGAWARLKAWIREKLA